MTPRPQRAPRGFTIVELLTVIAIIVFLLAMMAGVYVRYMAGAKVKAAKALMQKISIALEQYNAQCGRVYPPDSGYGCNMTGPKAGVNYDAGSLWRYLGQPITYKSSAADPGSVKGPFAQFTESELRPYTDPVKGKSFYVIDPWQNPIGYVADPLRVAHNRGAVDMFSAGPDGKTGCNDGIDNDSAGGVDNFDSAYDTPAARGEAAYNGALTATRKNGAAGEVLDDINNWDP
jgi:prepilin-type N-terminal cleavage/methylation domain-containing protein